MPAEKKRGNVFYRLFFNRRDERSYGRFAFFFDNLSNNFASIFASGAFYTAFLRLNNISIADVGIMTYMPIVANLSCLFSPFLFHHMKKRKAVLMSARLAYYLFNLVGVALVPFVVQDADTRVYLMAFFLSFANVIWGLFVGGFADWELNFLPQDGTREEFYAYRGVICSLVSSATSILAGFVAAAIETTPPNVQNMWLFWLRIGGFFFIIIDVLIFLRVKEYPYPKSEIRLRLKDIFVVPMRNRPFRNAMLVRGTILFATSLTISSWTYYLLDCGLGYSTLSFLSSIQPIMALVLTPIVLRLFRKMGCVNNFFFYRVVELFVYIGYALVIPATAKWLYPIVFVVFQIITVGSGVADINFVYLFMPNEDRLTHYSFYYASTTLLNFLGSFVGAQYITLTKGRAFTILGITFANVQLLMVFQAIFFLLAVALFAVMRRRLALAEREALA